MKNLIILIAIVLSAADADNKLPKPFSTPGSGKQTTKAPPVPPHLNKTGNDPGYHNISGKIVAGYYAYSGDYPYMASLKTNPSFAVCGASIMCERWVLTAAHCQSPRLSMVGVGSSYLPYQSNYQILYQIPHPLYNTRTGFNDIMLIKTATPMSFSSWVHPIQINTNPFYDEYYLWGMTLAGWGQTTAGQAGGIGSQDLRYINYNLEAPYTCRYKNSEGGLGPYNPAIQMCATAQYTYSYYRGACFGDSGGPLVYGFVQYGITSRVMIGNLNSGLCAVGYPDVFTRVSSYANWVAQTKATY